jgi:drug/metabolite transporter (DMT)-like permease
MRMKAAAIRSGVRRAAVTGPLIMLAAALVFAVLDSIIKTLGAGFRVWDIAFYRFAGGLVVLTAVFGRTGNPFRSPNRKMLLVRGVSGSLTFLCLVSAIRLIPLSTAMVLFFSFPAFAALFGGLFFGERLGLREALCLGAAILGIVILFDFDPAGGPWGQAMGIASGAMAGITVCLIRTLRQSNGPVVIYLYFCLIGSAVTLPGFAASPHLPLGTTEVLMVAGLIVTSIVAQLLMNQGFRYCRSWEGGLYMTSEVVFTAAFGVAVLGEALTPRFVAGGLLIFGSALALARLSAHRPPTGAPSAEQG